MKRGTPDHPKVSELAGKLGVQHYAAVGLLESMWHFTGRYSPRGNIGKFTDKAIADGVKWEREPVALIAGLYESGWLEQHTMYRLIVHHWAHHADQAVQKYLRAHGLEFVESENLPRMEKYGAGIEKSSLPEPEPEPEPKPTRKRGDTGDADFEAFFTAYPKCRQVKKKAAFRFWKAAKDKPPIAEILDAVENQKKSKQWRKDSGQWIPLPTTWLNAGQWGDAIPDVEAARERAERNRREAAAITTPFVAEVAKAAMPDYSKEIEWWKSLPKPEQAEVSAWDKSKHGMTTWLRSAQNGYKEREARPWKT